MTERPLILIVDDAPQIQRFLVHALGASGYDTLLAGNGRDALALVRARHPAAMILDLGLPDMDGKTVIEQLRLWSELPVIVLSAQDQEMEKILALDLGANDYITKPFAIGELLARLRVALRQAQPMQGGKAPILRSGGLQLDRAGREVAVVDQPVRLTPKEFDLLEALLEQPGRVMTHRQLLLRVWGPAHGEDIAYLRVFIGQLRQKLEAAVTTVVANAVATAAANAAEPAASDARGGDPISPPAPIQIGMIRTEPGIGYRWILPGS